DPEQTIGLCLPPVDIGTDEQSWPYEQLYTKVLQGDVLAFFQWFFDRGAHLVVMPIARIYLQRPVFLPRGITFLPPGGFDLATLNPMTTRDDDVEFAEVWADNDQVAVAELCSEASNVTA